MSFIDKRIAKYGYIKTEEDYYGLSYEKKHEKYVEELSITHKRNGKHLIFSCEQDRFTDDYCCIMSGIEIKAIKWFYLKYLYMRIKYRWN